MVGGFLCACFFKVSLHRKAKNKEVRAAAGEGEGEIEPADRRQNRSI